MRERRLYFDVLSGDLAAPDDVKFKFKFLDPASAGFPWVKFKDLVFTSKKKRELIDDLKIRAQRQLVPAELHKLEDHLDLVNQTFAME